jgi:uncharacterized membrane protein AbrB (regulator of aidB expression)
MKSYLIKLLLKNEYVRSAIADRADLSAFKKRPSLRILAGVFAIAFSYLIGWPAVSLLGTIAVVTGEPLIIAIGGPVTYGLSHLVFLLGMYMAGAEYSQIFFRWVTRIFVERLMKSHNLTAE